ncbi:DNA methyltransferase [Planococcus glaciei CHR43]|uniref:DNA cytosine methyltransferase n=1 Tax=Planococcus glaciei TaxID=459472 RepID=UPI0003DF0743|nr:DNA (cytosine-5-)-methyltransferase [Planococcus glaciei]ETP66967.1 DNA methyltransferase [Planococcus glaciei CHR43]
MGKKIFTFIDLFAGIGGFKQALDSNGGVCVGYSEIAKDAIDVYCDNFNISPEENFGDITKIKELPPHDLLTAGVPCQSWSIAGRNLGFDDDRGQLWNDTIYLLQQSKPKAFIFENVKGLYDPRNKEALDYILARINEAGYHAKSYMVNSYDYGVPQNRERIYIIGFREEIYFKRFNLPLPIPHIAKTTLAEVVGFNFEETAHIKAVQMGLFDELPESRGMSLSSQGGFNDYFLFNDIRNGDTTIHSWDIIETTERQKNICLLLLKNRRKSQYGKLDGNPLSLKHFHALDPTISELELDELVKLNILKAEEYKFEINEYKTDLLTEDENVILSRFSHGLQMDDLKVDRLLKVKKIKINQVIKSLKEKEIIKCTETRYDFKNKKISTGLNGINRIILPTSKVYPTLVASDSNDYIATKTIEATTNEEYKEKFLAEIYKTGDYRKITKTEACLIQGFPNDFRLPETRSRWMKLIGNSVSVPVIDNLCKAIVETGVFEEVEIDGNNENPHSIENELKIGLI